MAVKSSHMSPLACLRGRFGLGGAEDGERGYGDKGDEEARDEPQRGGGRRNGEVHGVLDRGCV
jgi:hypothetical protein